MLNFLQILMVSLRYPSRFFDFKRMLWSWSCQDADSSDESCHEFRKARFSFPVNPWL